ncbi:uncharacterized protein LOC143571972 [Bidens hawaiensis]|uniref:uncharacterized protein LOC143571972 n=1 Tax=Bidens hawaiensis TaxID=980011 RepID=UPI004049EED1
MLKTLLLYFVLNSTVAGAIWLSVSPHHHHHDSSVAGFTFDKLKSFQHQATEVIEEAVAKAGEKAVNIMGKVVNVYDGTLGALKDSLIKLKEWDPVDSPKRIGEDIGHNASVIAEQGVEQVKETVENVMETTPNEVLLKSKTAINDVNLHTVSLGMSVTGWCHLLGFSAAYGMGVWVTFFSGCVLGKCLPKHQSTMAINKMNMVYFRAMGCCVGATLLGFLVSQGTRGCLSNKMEMFQGFILVYALAMILTNLIFLERRATKLIAQLRMKGTSVTNSVAAEKLKKINAYSSILNVSTMVVLTWHLAYIGELLQARH